MLPFNRPATIGRELEYIADVIQNARLSGDGPFTARCHQILEALHPGARALLTTSGTHALEMAALLLDIGPGDEVIVPSFTFVSTVNAFVLRGATPVFADIRPDTLNVDVSTVAPLIGPRTKAIVVVHYAGVGCDMAPLVELAASHGIPLVEDAAHALFGHYRGTPLGTFGTFAALSFHETKNITCGEGGALLINDPVWMTRAEIVREKGTNRTQFARGQQSKYTWIDLGSSWLPSELLAAFLCAQLEARDRIQMRRQAIWRRYQEELADWGSATGVRLPTIPHDCQHPAHLFYLIAPTDADRRHLLQWLREADILAVSHYEPLHTAEMAQRLGVAPRHCPVTEHVAPKLLRLPLFIDLTPDAQGHVISTLRRWAPG